MLRDLEILSCIYFILALLLSLRKLTIHVPPSSALFAACRVSQNALVVVSTHPCRCLSPPNASRRISSQDVSRLRLPSAPPTLSAATFLHRPHSPPRIHLSARSPPLDPHRSPPLIDPNRPPRALLALPISLYPCLYLPMKSLLLSNNVRVCPRTLPFASTTIRVSTFIIRTILEKSARSR